MLALEVKGLAYTPKRLDNAKREQKASKFRAIRKTSVFGSKAAVHRNGPADAH